MPTKPSIVRNAIAFLQGRYPRATVASGENAFRRQAGGDVAFVAWPMIAQDPDSGVKQRAVAVQCLCDRDHLDAVAHSVAEMIGPLDSATVVAFDNADPKGHRIDTTQMAFAPRLLIYAGEVRLPYQVVMDVFASVGMLVDVVDESEMFSTVFISYGDPDQGAAASANAYLEGRGIKTWFFPDDARPGRKLHRAMHEEINRHDRVLLICSEASLTRPGVLNEIEKVLEREAKEGGTEILMPVTLDDYVYADWAPERRDTADQVRSRVITRIGLRTASGGQPDAQLEKVVKALSRRSR